MTLPASGGTISFTYDPLGRRIRKQSASATTIYAYDGDNIVEETDASGTAVARYAMGLSIDEPLAQLRSGATHYYSADGLGSITSLTNASGAVAASYTYDTFGNLAASAGSVVNPFRYTAREWDSETALYYHRARYHNHRAGRFVSEDPIRFLGGSNFYIYAHNNPIVLSDPSGLKVQICTRAGFREVFPAGGIGNHVYLLNPHSGQNCGRGENSGLENPSLPGTVCIDVADSDGREDEIMRCCQNTHDFPGPFRPFKNDCHNLVEKCIKEAGLRVPPIPGGRFGARCSARECQPGPWNEDIDRLKRILQPFLPFLDLRPKTSFPGV